MSSYERISASSIDSCGSKEVAIRSKACSSSSGSSDQRAEPRHPHVILRSEDLEKNTAVEQAWKDLGYPERWEPPSRKETRNIHDSRQRSYGIWCRGKRLARQLAQMDRVRRAAQSIPESKTHHDATLSHGESIPESKIHDVATLSDGESILASKGHHDATPSDGEFDSDGEFEATAHSTQSESAHSTIRPSREQRARTVTLSTPKGPHSPCTLYLSK